MHPSGGMRAGCRARIGRYATARRAPLNAHDASPTERDWSVVPATDSSKFGGEIRFQKISNGKLLKKSERVHGGIVGSLGGGDVGECCGLAARWNCSVPLQTHARARAQEAAAKIGEGTRQDSGGGGVNSSSRWDGGRGRRWSSQAPTGRRWRSGNDG
jgi:hypothetical protein